MERTRNQKILNIFSIIEYIAGIINVIIGILSIVTGGAVFGVGGDMISQGAATSEQVNQVGSVFIGHGAGVIIVGILHFVTGHLLKKVVNNPKDYKGAYIVVIISLVLAIINIITSIFVKDYQSMANGIVSLVISGFVFYLINKIKNSEVV